MSPLWYETNLWQFFIPESKFWNGSKNSYSYTTKWSKFNVRCGILVSLDLETFRKHKGNFKILWGGVSEEFNYDLVDQNTSCNEGGMGIRRLEAFIELFWESVWKVACDSEKYWRKVVAAKYVVERGIQWRFLHLVGRFSWQRQERLGRLWSFNFGSTDGVGMYQWNSIFQQKNARAFEISVYGS